MRQEPDHTFDQAISSAWQNELAATYNRSLKQKLSQREGELQHRFAEHYEKLRSLPRRMRRSLQRQWKRSLAGLALLMALGQAPALAATINVGGTCTLVNAIVAANNNITAGGRCRKGRGADTIVLPRNSTQTLTQVNNTNYGPTGLPTIRTQITIVGNGSRIQRVNTAPRFRIFTVAKTGKLTLQKTTVTRGAVQRGAGGIDNKGVLNLVESTVSGNQGCGVKSGEEYSDTGFYNDKVTVDKTTISGNAGCGIGASYSGSVVVTNSTISNYENDGIGVFIGRVRVVNSTISGNGKSGIALIESGAYIKNITITGISGSNPSLSFPPPGRLGGGVYVGYQASASITNCTISGNSADVGGGLYAHHYYDGSATLNNSTITGNTASLRGGGAYFGSSPGSFSEFNRTLVSGNSAPAGREIFVATDDAFPVADRPAVGNFNIFGFNGSSGLESLSPETTDIVPSQPLSEILDTGLANNGGPTRTHALVAGSPAIDAVNDGTCPPPGRDQRGVSRPQDGNGDGGIACDIGSFERQ